MNKHLQNEKTFTRFVKSLCCNNCKFFEESCTHKDHRKNEVDKSWFIKWFKSRKEDVNIDTFYSCENFNDEK